MVTETARAAWRQRPAWIVGASGLGLLLLSRMLAQFNFGSPEVMFVGEFGLAAIGLTAAALAVLLTVQFFFDDLDRGSLACLLTHGLRRGDYVVTRWAGVSVVVTLFVAVEVAGLGGMLAWRAHQVGTEPVPWISLLRAGALLSLKGSLIAAMASVLCMVASTSLFASLMTAILVATCHLAAVARDDAPFLWLRLLPDLSRFSPAWTPGSAGAIDWALPVCWLFYVGAFLQLAAIGLHRREL